MTTLNLLPIVHRKQSNNSAFYNKLQSHGNTNCPTFSIYIPTHLQNLLMIIQPGIQSLNKALTSA